MREENSSATTSAAVDTEGACGTLECSSGLHLSLVAAGDVFDGGRYDVTFAVEGSVESCQFALHNGDSCGLDPVCVIESTCDGPRIQFNFVLVPYTIGLVVGPSIGEADDVRIDVERDGRSLLSEVLVLRYQDYAPNGSDCEPVCRVAQAELPLP